MSAIVKEAQYTLKPESVKVKRYTRVIPSLGNNPSSGYAFGDTVIFYLPCGLANQVMDGSTATLRFTATQRLTATDTCNTNTTWCGFDYTAASLIRRIDIYGSGGSLISSVDRYNCLLNNLYDLSHSGSEMCGLSPLLGNNQTLYGNVLNNGGTTTVVTNEISRRSFTLANTSLLTSGTSTTSLQTFSIPLISPITSGIDKYLPIYALNDDIRIEIILDTQINSYHATTASSSFSSSYAMLNPSLIVDYLEIDEMAINQMKSIYAGRDLVLHAEDWHTYETTVASSTTGQWNTILPCKVMSAKMALFNWRRLGTTGATQAGFALSSRTNPFTGAGSTFNLNIGGNRVPQRPITVNVASGITEFFTELKKAQHALNHVEFTGNMSTLGYTSSETVAVGDFPNQRAFVAGINLDTLRGQSDVLLSGTDLSKVTTYIEANYVTNIVGDQTLNTFVKHDTLLVIDPNGTLVSKF